MKRISRWCATIIALLLAVLLATPALAADPYTGGTIPILRLTFADDVDPDTGDVTVTGKDKIQLMNESPHHEYQATGVTCTIEVPPSYDNPEADLWDGVSGHSGVTDLSLEYIRGRGNSTWDMDKKPYKLKLDKKADLFGLGSNKSWVLLANAIDESLVLDRLVGWLGDQIGMPYTPRGVPVDLFMNGEYYGSYLLMEDVRIDKSRVDIDEVPAKAGDPDSLDITGGYLLGIDNKSDSSDDEYFTTSRGATYSYDTPEYEPPLTEAQKVQQAYIASFLDRVEDAVYGDGLKNSAGESIWDLMDARSTADMWWIQEFTINPDAYVTPSTYLYKLRDTLGSDGVRTIGKLHWGPLWDFDFVWNTLDTGMVEGFDNTSGSDWSVRLRQDPGYVELLKERWDVLDAALEELLKEGGLLDGYIAELSDSWDANDEVWHVSSESEEELATVASCKEAVERIRGQFAARRAWINGHLEELPTRFYGLTFMDGDVVVGRMSVLEGGDVYQAPPKAPEKEGLFFKGWYTQDHTSYYEVDTVDDDITFYAEYVDNSSVTAATEIHFPLDEVWISKSGSVKYDAIPVGVEDRRIVWSSSDESVVVVGEAGILTPQEGCTDESGIAEAIVTAHLVNSGEDFPIRVVVYDPAVVTLPEVSSLQVSESITLGVGEHEPIELVVEPSPSVLNETFDLFFESEDNEIATVSSTGVVQGESPGTVNILVSRISAATGDLVPVGVVAVTVLEGEDEPEGGNVPEGEDVPEQESIPVVAPAPSVRRSVITYDLNGGTLDGKKGPVRKRYRSGSVVRILKAPTREGYRFLYWKGSRYAPGDKYTVGEDHTFVAQWERVRGGDDSDSPDKPGVGRRLLPTTGDDTSLLPGLGAFVGAVCAFALARVVRKRGL